LEYRVAVETRDDKLSWRKSFCCASSEVRETLQDIGKKRKKPEAAANNKMNYSSFTLIASHFMVNNLHGNKRLLFGKTSFNIISHYNRGKVVQTYSVERDWSEVKLQ
jgi:hypothetical protein